MADDFDNYEISIEGKIVLKVSVVHQATPRQGLKWLLEMAALWAFGKKQDIGEAVEHLQAEYEQITMDYVEQRRPCLHIVAKQS